MEFVAVSAKRQNEEVGLPAGDGHTSELVPDYDADPGRFAANQAATARFSTVGDVHAPVAERLRRAGQSPILDVGGGNGVLARVLDAPRSGLTVVVLDPAAHVAHAPRPAVRGDARCLPFATGAFGAVAALWMLYHLPDPLLAMREIARVLRPQGTFVACTSSRFNDPELAHVLPGWGREFVFDAETAVELVADVFAVTEVQRWDAPMVHLPDRAAVALFLRGRGLPRDRAEQAADQYPDPPPGDQARGADLGHHRVIAESVR